MQARNEARVGGTRRVHLDLSWIRGGAGEHLDQASGAADELVPVATRYRTSYSEVRKLQSSYRVFRTPVHRTD